MVGSQRNEISSERRTAGPWCVQRSLVCVTNDTRLVKGEDAGDLFATGIENPANPDLRSRTMKAAYR